jgi:hypothetical protein
LPGNRTYLPITILEESKASALAAMRSGFKATQEPVIVGYVMSDETLLDFQRTGTYIGTEFVGLGGFVAVGKFL